MNQMKIEFSSKSANEGFARIVVAAFMAGMNPTMEELSDVKTAVSEAVTNAIIHGYSKNEGMVRIHVKIIEDEIEIQIEDDGIGIEDLNKAMTPLYTSRPDLERSGMGFAFMQAFMDDLEVTSTPGKGTCIFMKKRIGFEGCLLPQFHNLKEEV